ncbi:hypothetical protein BU15DRAFT_55157, partial [Melanogaster broomeanus]
HAARWIPRAFDMYCNLDEVIKICLLVEDEASDTDDENAEDEKARAAHRKVLQKVGPEAIKRHQRVFEYLKEYAPYLVGLLQKKSEREKFNSLLNDMQQAISRTRSDDASHLKPVIGSYAAPQPDKKVIDPPINPKASKDRLGFNHPELTKLLCPVRQLRTLLEDPKIMSGSIQVTAHKWPAFLYSGDIPGQDFNPEQIQEGFLRGFLVELVRRHIFTSPSSALCTGDGGSMRNTRATNAKIHGMTQVDTHHLAYAAVQVSH